MSVEAEYPHVGQDNEIKVNFFRREEDRSQFENTSTSSKTTEMAQDSKHSEAHTEPQYQNAIRRLIFLIRRRSQDTFGLRS